MGKYDHINNLELIEKAQSGDKKAMNNLLDPLSKLARTWAKFHLRHTSNPEEGVEDVAQEALIKLCNNFSDYKPEKSALTTYFNTIPYNASIDFLRKQQRLDREAPSTETVELNVEEPNFERLYDTFKINEFREEAIRKLPPEQQDIVRIIDTGNSFREASERQKEALGTVKSRARLGYTKIRNHVELALLPQS